MHVPSRVRTSAHICPRSTPDLPRRRHAQREPFSLAEADPRPLLARIWRRARVQQGTQRRTVQTGASSRTFPSWPKGEGGEYRQTDGRLERSVPPWTNLERSAVLLDTRDRPSILFRRRRSDHATNRAPAVFFAILVGMIVRYAGLALLALVGIACTVLPEEESKKPDGAVCANSLECRSDQCIGDLCQGGGCKSASQCEPGWVCAHFEGGSGLFTSTAPFDACRAPCSATCPLHHSCTKGDEHCKPDPTWSSPRVTVPPARTVDPGTVVDLHADVSSPVGDPAIQIQWTVPTDDGNDRRSVIGQDVSFVAQRSGFVYRAEASATDSKNRRDGAVVEITVCARSGDRCADGSGGESYRIPCCTGAGICTRDFGEYRCKP
jgi:hypothetical protein